MLERSCPSKQRGDDAVLFLLYNPWGRPLGDSSGVPVMVLGKMKQILLEPPELQSPFDWLAGIWSQGLMTLD